MLRNRARPSRFSASMVTSLQSARAQLVWAELTETISSIQLADRCSLVDRMRPSGEVEVSRRGRDAQRLVDGGCQVERGPRSFHRLAAELIGGAHNGPAGDAAAREEDGLHQ